MKAYVHYEGENQFLFTKIVHYNNGKRVSAVIGEFIESIVAKFPKVGLSREGVVLVSEHGDEIVKDALMRDLLDDKADVFIERCNPTTTSSQARAAATTTTPTSGMLSTPVANLPTRTVGKPFVGGEVDTLKNLQVKKLYKRFMEVFKQLGGQSRDFGDTKGFEVVSMVVEVCMKMKRHEDAVSYAESLLVAQTRAGTTRGKHLASLCLARAQVEASDFEEALDSLKEFQPQGLRIPGMAANELLGVVLLAGALRTDCYLNLGRFPAFLAPFHHPSSTPLFPVRTSYNEP